MAAFDFPSPPVEDGFEVKNELTGITYKYDAASGSWVVVASSVQNNYYTKPEVDALLDTVSPDLIWEGSNPPLPDTPYKLWYSTDTLELYFYYCDPNNTCAWTPTSVPLTALEVITTELATTNAFIASVERLASANFSELQQIQENLGKVTLDEVLVNNNVSDESIVLTNMENDAILLSPEDARIMVGGVGESVVPRLELRHSTGIQDTSIVKLELDEDGARFDVECDEKVDNIHFRFEDDVKLEINKKGDAVFSGKVQAEPGVKDNELVTFGQLATVAEEIEQLAPSFERGLYTISTQEVTSSGSHNGKYNLIRKNNSTDNNAARRACSDARDTCKRIPDNDPIDCENQYMQCEAQIPAVGSVDKYITKFSEVEQLKFSKVDANGEEHTWDGVLIGQLIDVFNEDNDNYMVGRITAIEGTTVKTFTVDVLSSKGTASGKARIKIFTLNESADVDNYVRKTGDTMTGNLNLYSDTYDVTSNSYPKLIFKNPDDDGDEIKAELYQTDAYLRSTRSFESRGTLSANGNLQYNGSTRVGMSTEGGYLSTGTSNSKRALEWDKDGEVIKIQAWNGFGQQGQVLTVGANNTLMWETPAAAAPAQLSWEYRAPSSGKAPADGTFWLDSSHFRFSYMTKNGINLGSTKPAVRDEWYAAGARDDKGAFDMTLWRKTSSGWYMYDHIECDKTRWSITTDGVTHFQFRRKWASHDKTLSNGQTYYITVGGFF